MKVVAIMRDSTGGIAEAIIDQETSPPASLLAWWGQQAIETLEPHLTVEDVLKDDRWEPLELELPGNWQEGHLIAQGTQVTFVPGPQS